MNVLCNRRAGRGQNNAQLEKAIILTSRHHNPDEVHAKVIGPEVIRLRSTIVDPSSVIVQHGCCIIQQI